MEWRLTIENETAVLDEWARKMVRWPPLVGHCRFFQRFVELRLTWNLLVKEGCRLTFVIHGWFRKIYCGLAISFGGRRFGDLGSFSQWLLRRDGGEREIGDEGAGLFGDGLRGEMVFLRKRDGMDGSC